MFLVTKHIAGGNLAKDTTDGQASHVKDNTTNGAKVNKQNSTKGKIQLIQIKTIRRRVRSANGTSEKCSPFCTSQDRDHILFCNSNSPLQDLTSNPKSIPGGHNLKKLPSVCCQSNKRFFLTAASSTRASPDTMFDVSHTETVRHYAASILERPDFITTTDLFHDKLQGAMDEPPTLSHRPSSTTDNFSETRVVLLFANPTSTAKTLGFHSPIAIRQNPGVFSKTKEKFQAKCEHWIKDAPAPLVSLVTTQLGDTPSRGKAGEIGKEPHVAHTRQNPHELFLLVIGDQSVTMRIKRHVGNISIILTRCGFKHPAFFLILRVTIKQTSNRLSSNRLSRPKFKVKTKPTHVFQSKLNVFIACGAAWDVPNLFNQSHFVRLTSTGTDINSRKNILAFTNSRCVPSITQFGQRVRHQADSGTSPQFLIQVPAAVWTKNQTACDEPKHTQHGKPWATANDSTYSWKTLCTQNGIDPPSCKCFSSLTSNQREGTRKSSRGTTSLPFSFQQGPIKRCMFCTTPHD